MKIGGYEVAITHPEKILFPESGISKQELIDYYLKVSHYFLRYSKDRPVSMQRFPNGIGKPGFFQKKAGEYFPEWIPTLDVPKEGGSVRMVLINNKATLAYLSNQDVITHHLWLSRADRLHNPDHFIFDLDPPKGNFELVREAALYLREFLISLGLVPFVKTTGSKGLHVVIPVKREYEFDQTRQLARRIGEEMARQFPEKYTVEIRKEERKGRLFMDYLRNGYAQTAVAPYSVRAKEGAPVAMPISWEEVKDPGLYSQKYTIRNALEKLEKEADPWKDFFDSAASLRHAMKQLGLSES